MHHMAKTVVVLYAILYENIVSFLKFARSLIVYCYGFVYVIVFPPSLHWTSSEVLSGR